MSLNWVHFETDSSLLEENISTLKAFKVTLKSLLEIVAKWEDALLSESERLNTALLTGIVLAGDSNIGDIIWR